MKMVEELKTEPQLRQRRMRSASWNRRPLGAADLCLKCELKKVPNCFAV